jgi:hypothetical protein
MPYGLDRQWRHGTRPRVAMRMHAMPWHHVWRSACNVLAAMCGYARQWLIAAAPPAMPSERTAEWTVW